MSAKLSNKTIVITRPLGDEGELRDALQENWHHVICEPLTEIILNHTTRFEVAQALTADPDAVIITSSHGVRALSLLSEERDVFLLCVGEKTADIAADLGFARISLAGENVDGLIDYITSSYDDDARFLYISGEHISVDLGEVLAVSGMQVQRVVVYEAVAAEMLSDTLVEQLKRGQIDAISFFSKRAVEIFLELAQKSNVQNSLSKIDAFCLSENIAQIAKQAEESIIWRNVYTARKATLASLLNCIDNAYANQGKG
jgi:uroporphyrinogen-III synthase